MMLAKTVDELDPSQRKADILFHVLRNALQFPVFYFRYLLKEMFIVPLRLLKTIGIGSCCGLIQSCKLHAEWAAPQYFPVTWRWSLTVCL